MNTASILVAVLCGNMTVSEAAPCAVCPDYASAFRQAAQQNKRLLVHIGHVSGTLATYLQQKPLPAAARQLLQEQFVLVELSRDSDEGTYLARQLGMDAGVVVSTPGGQYQDFRRAGTDPGELLDAVIQRYTLGGSAGCCPDGSHGCCQTKDSGDCSDCSKGTCSAGGCSATAAIHSTCTSCSGATVHPAASVPTTRYVAPARRGLLGRRGAIVTTSSCSSGTCPAR